MRQSTARGRPRGHGGEWFHKNGACGPSVAEGAPAASARRHRGGLCGGTTVHGQLAAGKLQPLLGPGPLCSGARERPMEVQAWEPACVRVGQPCLSTDTRSRGFHASPGRYRKRLGSHRVASHVLLERLGPLDNCAPRGFTWVWPRPG